MIQAADTDGDGRIDFEGGRCGGSLRSLSVHRPRGQRSGSPLPGADPSPQAHSHL